MYYLKESENEKNLSILPKHSNFNFIKKKNIRIYSNRNRA